MSAQAHDFIAFILQIAQDAVRVHMTVAVEGLVVPNSWDPTNGTVQVMVGTTGTLNQDSSSDVNGPGPDQMVIYPTPVPLMTPHVGFKGGPIGMERVILSVYEGGLHAHLMNSFDNTPPVPQGEIHAYLRSLDMNQVMACFMRVTQNATELGHAQQVNVLAPTISLGSNQPQNGNQLVRQQDLQQAIDDVTNNVQDALDNLTSYIQGGDGVTSPSIDVADANSSEVSYST